MRCSALATRANATERSRAPRWTDNNHLHDLLVVAVAVAHHDQHLRVALLTPVGSRHHASFDHVDHQGTFGPIADVDPPPGLSRQAVAHVATPCQGRLGRRPLPLYSGSAVSRSRINVFEGTANRYRLPKAASRRRNQDGRPISSSPAIHPCGSRPRCPPASPRPTGDACGSLGGLWAPRLFPNALYPGSIPWADTAACRPACGPWPTRSPNRAPLGSCRLCPERPHHCRATPTDSARIWGTPRDQRPSRHRLVPIAAHLANQLLSQGGIVPFSPADKALQSQALLAKMIGDRFDVFAFHIGQQALHIGQGVRPRGLAG